MNIHFQLPLKSIADLLNQRFDDVIFEGDLAKSRAWAKVQKYAPITVDGEGDKIYVSVPLDVHARLTFRERIFGDMLNMLPRLEKTRFRITAHFTVRLEADDHWNVSTFTLGSFRWDKVPEVGLGPLKVKITSFLRALIQSEIAETALIIDKQILEEVALKKRLDEAWLEIQQPIALHDDPAVWLLISPKSDKGIREALTSDHVCIDTAVSLPLTLSLSLKESKNQPEAGFPLFEKESDIQETFSNLVETKLEYAALEDYFKDQVYPLPSNKGSLRFNSINIKASSPSLHIEMLVEGNVTLPIIKSAFTAMVQVDFSPQLNKDYHIEPDNLNIQVSTSKWWLRNVNRFGNSFLKKTVTNILRQSIQEIDSQVKKELQEAFKGTHIADTLLLKGEVDSLQHQGIRVEEKAFLIQSRLEGSIVFEVTL